MQLSRDSGALDCRNKRLNISGNCLETLDVCQAMCCSMFNVDITSKEYKSGKYKAHPFCLLTEDPCRHDDTSCVNRKWRLERRKDGYCVYLDEDTRKCSIHEKRPLACRDFNCKGGWKIYFDFAASDQKLQMRLEELGDDMVFMLNPLMKLKTLFYSSKTKEVSFAKKPVNKCGILTTRGKLDNDAVNDDILLHIVRLFDGKTVLGDIRSLINKEHGIDLSKTDFNKIVWLFNNHGIIVFRNEK